MPLVVNQSVLVPPRPLVPCSGSSGERLWWPGVRQPIGSETVQVVAVWAFGQRMRSPHRYIKGWSPQRVIADAAGCNDQLLPPSPNP